MLILHRLIAILVMMAALSAPAQAQVAEAASTGGTENAEVEAYAYFSLTISAIAQGNESAAQQAAATAMNAVQSAVAGGSNETGVLLEIYASLEGFLSEGTLNYQGGEFDSDGVWLTDSAGETYFATYEELGALLTQALTPQPIIFDDSMTFDQDPWEVYGPGEQPGDSGGSDGSASYQGSFDGDDAGGDDTGSGRRLGYDEDEP